MVLVAFMTTSCLTSNGVQRVSSHDGGAATANPFAGIPVISGTPVRTAALLPMRPLEPTGPSFVATLGQRDRLRATLCLASAIYYEAATEPDEGQRAVAQVVLNRVQHPQWPHTICGVVYQGSSTPGCQFSFACDGAMARAPMLSAWIRARRVAERALAGEVYQPVGSATFYHTMQVTPGWRLRMTPVAIVGAHIFYRMPGEAPDARSLPMRYVGGEPVPGPLPSVAPVARLMQVALPTETLSLPAREVVPPGAPADREVPVLPSRDSRYVAEALPDSTIRDEYRDSGQWIAR